MLLRSSGVGGLRHASRPGPRCARRRRWRTRRRSTARRPAAPRPAGGCQFGHRHALAAHAPSGRSTPAAPGRRRFRGAQLARRVVADPDHRRPGWGGSRRTRRPSSRWWCRSCRRGRGRLSCALCARRRARARHLLQQGAHHEGVARVERARAPSSIGAGGVSRSTWPLLSVTRDDQHRRAAGSRRWRTRRRRVAICSGVTEPAPSAIVR